jgi:hypothetical protein
MNADRNLPSRLGGRRVKTIATIRAIYPLKRLHVRRLGLVTP